MVESEWNQDNGRYYGVESPMADNCQLHSSGVIQEIISFWRSYGYHDITIDDLRTLIEKHLNYNTLEVIKTDKVVGVVRYNIEGEECHVLDTVIHPNYRNKNILKLMICRGIRKYPFVKFLVYERELKDTRKRRIPIMTFLGVKHG